MIFLLFLLFFVIATVLTDIMRRYSLKFEVLDFANQRSMHSVPTPRGGGVAIVLTFLLALIYLRLADQLDGGRINVFLCSLVIAAIGFWDDHKQLSSFFRFAVHVLTALAVVWLMPSLAEFNAFNFWVNSLFINIILVCFFLVWWLNLFNFMDGIDGIAASEALFFCSAYAGFLYQFDLQLCQVALFLAASAAGFLFWNRPRAVIFMGDVGSGFLGFVMGLLVLMAAEVKPVMLFIGMILYGVFFVDATYTLLIRVLTRQQWAQPHRTHTYQIMARQMGHGKTLIVAWLMNVCWLLPLSIWVFYQPQYVYTGLILAYIPIIYIAFRCKAGLFLLHEN